MSAHIRWSAPMANDIKIERVPVQFNAGIRDASGDAISNAAADVTVADVGTYYAGTDVEAVTQEIGASLAALTASEVAVVDTGGYYTAAEVEAVLQEVGVSLAAASVAKTITATGAGGASPTTVTFQYQEDGVNAEAQVYFKVWCADANTRQPTATRIAPPVRSPVVLESNDQNLYVTAANGSADVAFSQAAPGTANEVIYVELVGGSTIVSHTIAFTM